MSPRFRDHISQPLTIDYFHQRLSQGWILTAVEWTRPADEDDAAAAKEEEIPYGRQISDDGTYLVEQSREMEVVAFVYDGIIGGVRPAQIARELNQRDYRTRDGLPWTAPAVFNLMPRIIELSPRLQRRPEWPTHRAQLDVIT